MAKNHTWGLIWHSELNSGIMVLHMRAHRKPRGQELMIVGQLLTPHTIFDVQFMIASHAESMKKILGALYDVPAN